MSVKSPGKSDLLDRHEVYETFIEIGLRELEVQPEAIENGVLSPEAREIMRIFKEDLERTSEFMDTEEFKSYARRETRKYVRKIRMLKHKEEKEQPEKESELSDKAKLALKKQHEETKKAGQKTTPKIPSQKTTPQQGAVTASTTAAGTPKKTTISRGHDLNQTHESKPEHVIILPKPRAQQTQQKKVLPTDIPKTLLPTGQKQPGKKPLKIKYVIPPPNSSTPDKTKAQNIGPFKTVPFIPESYEVADYYSPPVIEPDAPEIEPDEEPFEENPIEAPSPEQDEPEYPDESEDSPDSGDYGGDGGSGGAPPGRPPRRSGIKPGNVKRLGNLENLANNPALKRALGATPWGRAVLLALEVKKRRKQILLIIVGVAIGIVLLITMVISILGDEEARTSQGVDTKQLEEQGLAQLTITKTGPSTGAVNTEITYEIKATYPGSAQDVIVRDTLPQGVQYAPKDCTAAEYNPTTRTITWSARKILTARGQTPGSMLNNVNMTLRLTVRVLPEANNKHIVNQAIGEVIGGSGGSNSTPGTGTAPNVGAGNFEALVNGQGRNTQILGDENQFVSTLMKNGAKHFSGKETQLRALYKAAIAKNVNPLIMAVIWGVEAGFRVNGTEFGCKPFGSGFASQVSCSANTLNKHMADFEKAKKSPFPHPVAPQCTFTDPFVYAYERYTPVCAINDSNGHARENFVKFFKELYGK